MGPQPPEYTDRHIICETLSTQHTTVNQAEQVTLASPISYELGILSYLDVVDEDLAESSWQHVSGQLGGTVTDVGHEVDSLEATADTVVNTFRLPPVALDLVIAIALVADELLRPLLDDLWAFCWSDGHLVPKQSSTC